MTITETKTDAIRDAFNADIKNHSEIAQLAFADLEKMNISDEEYKKANWRFCLNNYIAEYLRRIKSLTVDSNEPLKTIENRIRFHVHQQRTKGQLGDMKQEISVAQAAVTVILDEYVERFF